MGDSSGLAEEGEANEEDEKDESPVTTRSDIESSWESSRTGDMRLEER